MRKVKRKVISQKDTNALFESSLQYFFQNASAAFQSLNINGELISVNNAWLDTLGYSNEEVIGKHFSNFITKDLVDFFNERYTHFKNTGFVDGVEFKLVKKDGNIIYVTYKGECIYDENGNLLKTNCVFEDISELRKTEEAFSESVRTAQALINSSTDAAFIIDIKGTYVELNDIVARRMNKSREELIGKNAYDFLPDEVATSRKKIVDQVCRKKRELYLVDKRAGRVFENHVTPILDDKGEVQLLVLSSIDITERERDKEQNKKLDLLNEKLLQFSKFSSKLDLITQGVVDIFNAEFSRLWVKRPCDYHHADCPYSFESDELKYCNQQDGCLHLLSSSGCYNEIDGSRMRVPQACSMVGKIMTGEFRSFISNDLLKDHSNIDKEWVKELGLKSFSGYRLHSEEGQAIGVLVLFSKNEIDEETGKKMRILANTASHVIQTTLKHDELSELKLKQDEAVKAANVGVWEWNLITDQVHYSTEWKNQIGYADNEIQDLFKEWEVRVHPDDLSFVLNKINHCLKNELPNFQAEFRFKHRDGTYRNILARGSTVRNGRGKLSRFIGSHFDITEQKKNEEMLQEANITKDKFFSIIAHELRGPIGSMIELTKMFSNNEINISKERRKKIDQSMIKTLSHIYDLLDKLLTWSRAERGLIELDITEFEVNDLINENISILSQQAENKEIILNNLSKSSEVVKADVQTSNTVMRNLLSNAIKFTKRNGVVLIDVRKVTVDGRNFCEISVSDSGIGMTEEKQSSLFKLERRKSTTGTEREPGTGLGLVLCEEFVRKNGGEIRVESELNKGSTFYFTLPLVE